MVQWMVQWNVAPEEGGGMRAKVEPFPYGAQ